MPMKLERNKLIFIGLLACVVLFIVGYALKLQSGDEENTENPTEPQVPPLAETQEEYQSKLEAVNAVEQERDPVVPSVYPETLLDSSGLYDPLQEEKERQRLVDSIYRHGRIQYVEGTEDIVPKPNGPGSIIKPKKSVEPKEPRDFTESHTAFFDKASPVGPTEALNETSISDPFVIVEVNGEQTVRANGRLELRLATDAVIQGQHTPKNTLLFGLVTIQPNRVLLDITNIEHRPVRLKAFDILDGNEGLYIENSFRAEARREVADDVVQGINVPGMPQVGSIKQVFRRNNRNVQVTIRNQYQLLLK